MVVRPLVLQEKYSWRGMLFWRLADFWADFGAHGPAWPFEVDPATLELSADAGDPRALTSAAQGCSLLRPGLQPPASMLRPLRPRVAASGAQGCSQEDLQPPQFHTRYLSSVAAPYLARYLRYLRIFMYNESVSSPYLRLYLHRILWGLKLQRPRTIN